MLTGRNIPPLAQVPSSLNPCVVEPQGALIHFQPGRYAEIYDRDLRNLAEGYDGALKILRSSVEIHIRQPGRLSPVTIGVHADRGSGKSTIVRMVNEQLKREIRHALRVLQRVGV
jgi:hypothetical protein